MEIFVMLPEMNRGPTIKSIFGRKKRVEHFRSLLPDIQNSSWTWKRWFFIKNDVIANFHQFAVFSKHPAYHVDIDKGLL